MVNTIKYLSRLSSMVVLAVIISSCDEDHSLKEETFYFNEENRGWVCADSLDETFTLEDENGISLQYIFNGTSYEFNKSWGVFLGINTLTTHTEISGYAYKSNYGTGGFRIGLRAGMPPDPGDCLTVHIDQMTFTFDFANGWLTQMGTSFSDRSNEYLYRDNENSGPILSTCEIVESINVNDIEYDQVLHFVRKDLMDYTNSYSIVEIYLSKSKGLIWYIMKNGLETKRVGAEFEIICLE